MREAILLYRAKTSKLKENTTYVYIVTDKYRANESINYTQS